VFDGKNIGVFIWLDNTGSLAPGDSAQVPINFLDREAGMKHVALGKKFFLREGRQIGEGIIDEICGESPTQT
jgi:GTPase